MWTPIPSEFMAGRILYTVGDARFWILEQGDLPDYVDRGKSAMHDQQGRMWIQVLPKVEIEKLEGRLLLSTPVGEFFILGKEIPGGTVGVLSDGQESVRDGAGHDWTPIRFVDAGCCGETELLQDLEAK